MKILQITGCNAFAALTLKLSGQTRVIDLLRISIPNLTHVIVINNVTDLQINVVFFQIFSNIIALRTMLYIPLNSGDVIFLENVMVCSSHYIGLKGIAMA